MSRRILVLTTCFGVFALAACEKSPSEPDVLVALEDAQERSASRTATEAPMLLFSNPSTVVGGSALIRTANGVQPRIRTKDLNPGSAVTLWLVVFNEPDQCDGICDDPDVFGNPNAKVDILYADGTVVRRTGKARFGGGVNVGDASGSIMALLGGQTYGLMDAQKAEIHFVLRDHGPVIDALRHEMTHTFNGGCTGFPAELGTPGPNTCEDIQFAVHLPQ